jgi:hypothetical protein
MVQHTFDASFDAVATMTAPGATHDACTSAGNESHDRVMSKARPETDTDR